MKKSVEQLLDWAVSGGIAPRVSAVFGRPGQIYSFETASAASQPIYDLASLTKIISTTVLCAKAICENKLALDERPWQHWPDISIASILNHTSGLPWWRSFYELVEPADWGTNNGKQQVIEAVLSSTPGSSLGQTVYSDLGFIALGFLLEQRFGMDLRDIFKREAKHCYGDNSFDFGVFEVNDRNCEAMGRVSGHAGLFGTLRDVQKAAEFFLRCLVNPKSPLEKVLRDFAHYASERALGFDRATPDGATAGVLSNEAVGHLGFTGTSMWIDPKMGAYFVLLTDRFKMGDQLDGIKRLRREFHRAAVARLKSP